MPAHSQTHALQFIEHSVGHGAVSPQDDYLVSSQANYLRFGGGVQALCGGEEDGASQFISQGHPRQGVGIVVSPRQKHGPRTQGVSLLADFDGGSKAVGARNALDSNSPEIGHWAKV